MTARLAAGVFVSALMRRVNAEGGYATLLARGDPTAGAILLVCAERGTVQSVRERVLTTMGSYAWQPVGPAPSDDAAAVNDYLSRRRNRDADLWVIELDVPNSERFADEMTGEG